MKNIKRNIEEKIEGKGGRGGEKCRVSGWGEEHLSPGQHRPPPLQLILLSSPFPNDISNLLGRV